MDSRGDGGVTDEGGRKDEKGPEVVTDQEKSVDKEVGNVDKEVENVVPQGGVDAGGTDEGGRKDEKGPGQPDTGLPAKEQSGTNSDLSDSTGSQQHAEEQEKEVVTTVGPSAQPLPPPPDSDRKIGKGVEAAPLTVEDLKKLWKEATAKEKEEKKRLKEELSDLKRKRLREARAELKEAIQAARKKPKLEPKEPDPLDSNDDASSSSDDEGKHTGKSVRKRLTQVEKWANGHKAMRERQHSILHLCTAIR